MKVIVNRQSEYSEQQRSITAKIIEKHRPERIILFGSAARGEFHHDSDIDLLIIKKRD
jgi:predicted nucleotidyltransferase